MHADLLDEYERQVVMHHDGMRFIGIERPRGDDGPAYVQEWSVMILPG